MAFESLLYGNKRFVSGVPGHPNQDAGRRAELAPGQDPFAVVLGCSDSRLAAEIIFDQGLGDLFVVRTAGHVLGAEVLGSVEYATSVLGARLVVVLGHDSCGAVAAARAAVEDGLSAGGFVSMSSNASLRASSQPVRPDWPPRATWTSTSATRST